MKTEPDSARQLITPEMRARPTKTQRSRRNAVASSLRGSLIGSCPQGRRSAAADDVTEVATSAQPPGAEPGSGVLRHTVGEGGRTAAPRPEAPRTGSAR